MEPGRVVGETGVGAPPPAVVASRPLLSVAAATELPSRVSPSRAYGWLPPPLMHQDRALLVGDPERLHPLFAEFRHVARVAADPPICHAAAL